MAALVSRNYIKPIREQIDDFSFPFIAPLGTNNNNDHVLLNYD
jgi:hypothetical protein